MGQIKPFENFDGGVHVMKRYVSAFPLLAVFLFFIGLAVLVISGLFPGFAELISDTVGFALRITLAKLTSFLPFSVAEVLVVFGLLTVVGLAAYIIFKSSGKEKTIRCIVTVIAILSIVFNIYVFTLGVGYKRIAIENKLYLTGTDEITADNLDYTLRLLAEKTEYCVKKVQFNDDGASICPYDTAELSEMICEAYARLDEEYPELKLRAFESKAKPALSSGFLTSVEILGIYSFFTGEANVNTVYPDYTLPYSIAHEFAHQRGIARENEANFIAFLVCIRSDDSYIKYSGYLNMLEYVAAALGKTDAELLKSAYSDMDSKIISELLAYSRFYQEHKNVNLSKISSFINDKYLKSQGTEGIVSYGLATELCVEYYRKDIHRAD